MRFTAIKRIIVKTSRGDSVWKEVSTLRLPKGGKKLEFNLNFFIGVGFAIGAYFYIRAKGIVQPESKAAAIELDFCRMEGKNQQATSPLNAGAGEERPAVPQPIGQDTLKALIEEPSKETKDFYLQQTMLRIKDPKISIPFYCNVLGMRLLKQLDFPQGNFSLFFVGYESPEKIPSDENERKLFALSTPGTLELTHNWGTENDPSFTYHNGNKDPRGYGHIGIAVKDVYAASERFEKLGVKFVKRPDDGKMKGLAFIEDPDGYWIEIFNPKTI